MSENHSSITPPSVPHLPGRSLKGTFIPESLSMNFLLAAMVPVAALGRALLVGRWSPATPAFWFVAQSAL